MNELSERARGVAEKFSKVKYVFPPAEVTSRGFSVEAFGRVSEILEKEIERFTLANLPKLIEQALLAERRLAMGEAAKIADNRAEREEHIRSIDWSAQLLGVGAAKAIAEELRAAAEKEVGK